VLFVFQCHVSWRTEWKHFQILLLFFINIVVCVADILLLLFQYPQILPLHTVMGIGFQVSENLNPGVYNPSTAPMASAQLASAPGTTSMPLAPSSASNPSDTMFQMSPALAAAIMAHQQGSAQMMSNSSNLNPSEQNKGSTGKDDHSMNGVYDAHETSSNNNKK
jgi:hypothetical protein